MAKIIELIITQRKVGRGTKGDPCRQIIQLFTKEGELIGEVGYKEDGDRTYLNRHGLSKI